MMKILFINAIDSREEVERRHPPLGIGYLVAILRQKFGEQTFRFKIVDCRVEREIKKFKPDLVGISSVTQNYHLAGEYARLAKKYNLPVIIGGVHISMVPTSLTENMDVGVLGEGEETICDLVGLLLSKNKLLKEDLAGVKGIVYRDEDKKICLTPEREPIAPLDKIPLPARDLFKIKNQTYMFTSRGCPDRCTFCSSCRFWGKVRFFSARYVVKEIKHLIKYYKVNSINFQDDIFIFNKERVREIVDLLEKEKILGKVTFECSVRANLVDREIARLLKKMGVRYVYMGLESAQPDILKYLKGSNVTVEDNQRAIDTIKRQGIRAYGSFIIGSPQENREDILATLKFIKQPKLDSFEVYVLTPLPGTPVWEYALSRGLVSEKMDWDRLKINFAKHHKSAVILSEWLSREELFKLYKMFQRHQRRKKIVDRIHRGIEQPQQIPAFLLRKLKNKFFKV